MKTDRQIVVDVVNEWNSGAGGSFVVETILRMLLRMEKAFKDELTIEGICDALDEITTYANAIKKTLIKEKEKGNDPVVTG